MKKKEYPTCVKCGRNVDWMLSFATETKDGKRGSVAICFECLWKQAKAMEEQG